MAQIDQILLKAPESELKWVEISNCLTWKNRCFQVSSVSKSCFQVNYYRFWIIRKTKNYTVQKRFWKNLLDNTVDAAWYFWRIFWWFHEHSFSNVCRPHCHSTAFYGENKYQKFLIWCVFSKNIIDVQQIICFRNILSKRWNIASVENIE